MSKDWKADIQTLLTNTRIGFLSTLAGDMPESSMCPYAVYQGDIIIHLSALAKHSKNIAKHANVGLMIYSPETPHSSPLALPRLSFTGNIEAVPESDIAAY
ncbi:MAG: pyridoxamine 5'-phosphate oxidase family protein, partial [Ghiorsea sp.]|nr:pyridoxamine 5'-phosphate oxidase family protein [Ghiorsea sp.]